MTNEKVYQMDFNKVLSAAVSKAVKKGAHKGEVDQVTWLAYRLPAGGIGGMAEKTVSYGDFFSGMPPV